MKNKYFIFFLILAGILIIGSCKEDFLTVKPAGSLDENVLASPNGIEGLLIGAYSMLDGQDYRAGGWGSATTNWVYGSIRGLEANKGTDAGDQPFINPIQTFSESPTNDYLNSKWRTVYDAIARCNATLKIIDLALNEKQTITQEQADEWTKQIRALRGWYHFDAWRMWGGKVPYVDENTDPYTVANTADIRPQIIADLTEGTKLPINMGAIGKFNKTVCQILLAEAIMDMNKDYTGALALLNDARTNGKKPDGGNIGLAATYGEIFDIVNRNGIEAIYTVQYSVNDGSGGANGGNGEVLNFPYKGGGSPGGCCGFFNPTQEFVNSFRTTAAGLPLLDNTYNSDPVKNDQAVPVSAPYTPDAGRLDPRLDWSVGRRGIPYWDWGKHTGADWIRDQTYSGPFSPKKQVYKKSQEGTYTEVGNWTSGWTANGYRMIRYANLLLLIAECEIEAGSLDNARTLVNLVRARAANPAGFVMDGAVPAANYVISQYPATGAPFDSKANARTALYMERKLELGQEGHRWFDLNRWGITVTELNRALTYEKTMPWGANLYGSAVVAAEDTSFPIPQRQIDLSEGNLVQNR
jgi:starch-binding outer membrane protein, SusD/RagB family